MAYQVPHFIGGKPVSSAGRKLDIFNPATGRVAGQLAVADQTIIHHAVMTAQTAFSAWSQLPAAQRAKLLFRYKTLLDQHIHTLAKLITAEHGKTLTEAEGSVQRGIDVVEFACGITTHLKSEFAKEVATDIDCYSLRQPLGVCVGITPFNFPGMIPLWMFPIAIACGNTFIIKPSEKAPSCAVKLVELAQEAGIPDGVVNIIQGDKEAVDGLITHPDVKAVSFVGSSVAAKQVYETAILHGKRAQAFGGAKNHCVVMPDADMEQTAKAIVMSAYGSAGERCMAVSVVMAIGDEVADKLIQLIQPKVEALIIGPGNHENTELGPLVTQSHWERVKSYIELGVKEGAKLIIDGSQYRSQNHVDGFFMGGCLFDHVKPDMRIYQEEIFGPVLCIVRVPDLTRAIELINAHPYGNGVSIYTADGYTARLFVEKIQVGMVGVNMAVPVPVPQHSFGGWKQSIFADIGMYGAEGVRFYTKLKTVTERWFKRTLPI